MKMSNKFIWCLNPLPCNDVMTFDTPVEKPFESIVGNGENTRKQHFLLYSRCFLLCENRYIV